jgi:protein-tyrosine phosphatase
MCACIKVELVFMFDRLRAEREAVMAEAIFGGKMQTILMVCLGNICRSPMAEGAVRRKAAARGMTLTIDSAGTGGWHSGDAPDPRAIKVCGQYGVDITSFRARQIVAQDFRRFDLILALDGSNLMHLHQIAPPDETEKIRLFGEYAGVGGVVDPYYGSLNGFDDCWKQIERAADGLLDAMQSGRV